MDGQRLSHDAIARRAFFFLIGTNPNDSPGEAEDIIIDLVKWHFFGEYDDPEKADETATEAEMRS